VDSLLGLLIGVISVLILTGRVLIATGVLISTSGVDSLLGTLTGVISVLTLTGGVLIPAAAAYN